MPKKIIHVLNATSGWRARQEIGTLLEQARTSFSAASHLESKKDWEAMLVELADGISEARKLAGVIRRYSRLNKPKPMPSFADLLNAQPPRHSSLRPHFMLKAKDLPGWKGIRRIHHFKSVTEAMRLVRDGKVASTAGHAGAINAYRDRAGDWRGQLCHYCSVVSEICTASPSKFRAWLKENYPKIGDTERLAAR